MKLRGLENVTRASFGIVVSRKWVRFGFFGQTIPLIDLLHWTASYEEVFAMCAPLHVRIYMAHTWGLV